MVIDRQEPLAVRNARSALLDLSLPIENVEPAADDDRRAEYREIVWEIPEEDITEKGQPDELRILEWRNGRGFCVIKCLDDDKVTESADKADQAQYKPALEIRHDPEEGNNKTHTDGADQRGISDGSHRAVQSREKPCGDLVE